MTGLVCFNCGASLTEVPTPLSRRADCPACRAELHCCRMCRLYDPKVPDQCHEDRAEPPTRKDVANFCEWFTPAGGRGPGRTREDEARARLDGLFGAVTSEADAQAGPEAAGDEAPGADEDPEAAARRRLDDLFS